jgi:hypothetical protein
MTMTTYKKARHQKIQVQVILKTKAGVIQFHKEDHLED